ncbi:probable Rho GTPase-activating protein CG5521 isoform X2 [Armigeres subalbatus]|uniref:probable Rho GTPase-activating protein CG5521 isoform X2 n=1 Tax=Armigeres subalbatus TaxID=124917 RepID=UPI002ED62CF7
MFTKKSNIDLKKSTAKIQDSKKDSTARLRHLKTILEHVDSEEAKNLFEANYSHVYYILYDTFVQAEANLRQRVHKTHREELDGSLWLLSKILTLLPELIARRWQVHSLGRILAKLLHYGNSVKLRREGVRYFLLWYQALGDNAPPFVDGMFTELVPGLTVPQKGRTGPLSSDSEYIATTDILNHPNMKGELGGSVFHDTGAHPVKSPEIQPLIPPSSSERTAAPDPRDGLEILLDCMVQSSGCLKWRDNNPQKHIRTLNFLLTKFREHYLPVFCPNFDYTTSIYEPKLDLPAMRNISKREEVMSSCIVVLVIWIAKYTHERHISTKLDNIQIDEESVGESASLLSNLRHMGYTQTQLVRDVLYSSRETINFVHEIYRQAFLMSFTSKSQIEAMRIAISVYRDWMSTIPPPAFLLEPDTSEASLSGSSVDVQQPGTRPNSQRLRTDSYLGAISKENVIIRAGLQNVLQVFVTNAVNVFMVNTAHLNIHFQSKTNSDGFATPLDEQTDICKRVLNIYRTMVMKTRMEAKTWEQLLLVLLQVTSVILQNSPPNAKKNNLGGRLAQPIFQTLIVTWIRAHTNVVVNPGLWDKFLKVLSSLTHREELIVEWDKTMQTLTRVLARQVYNINLSDLPLDRLAEQKGKRKRGTPSSWTQNSSTTSDKPDNIIGQCINNGKTSTEEVAGDDNRVHGQGHSVRSIPGTPSLNRSYSEGSLAPFRKSRARRRIRNKHQTQNSQQHVAALPLNVEHSLNRMLSNASGAMLSISNENLDISRFSQCDDSLVMGVPTLRRALSLDSIRPTSGKNRGNVGNDTDSYRCGSRSPSPTASSGIESGSIKDSPMQIDVLTADSSSIDTQDENSAVSADRRSILAGGSARGWLPDVAAVMWRRMLGALGDVNKILNPKLHAQVFQYLVSMTESLIKIRMNQGISLDGQPIPVPLNLVPPIALVAPWCYGALTLDGQYSQGKLYAMQLLCTIVKSGACLGNCQFPLFYHALHQALSGEDRAMAYTALRYLGGPRFLSLLLPGHTLLLLDLVHASTIVLTSSETGLHAPRAQVAGLLGSLLCFPKTSLPGPVLQPSEPNIDLMECPDLQEHVLNIVLRCARREPTAKARSIAIASLGQWILQNLTNPSNQNSQSSNTEGTFKQRFPQHHSGTSNQPREDIPVNPRIREAFQVILQALQFKHRTIARLASETLKLCAEQGHRIERIERLPQLIIDTICLSLEIQNVPHPKESDKTVLTSLLLTLGEFCMSFSVQTLQRPKAAETDEPLIQVVFKVLYKIAMGIHNGERIKLFTTDEDFDMTITVDDVREQNSSNEPTYQTSESVASCQSAIRLCAKTVAMHLITNLGHFPMGIGATRLSSLVDEQDDLAGGSTTTLLRENSVMSNRESMDLGASQVLASPNLQLLMLSSELVASFIELPALKLPGGGATAGLITANRQVRLLLRDLNGKACWDASILYKEPSPAGEDTSRLIKDNSPAAEKQISTFQLRGSTGSMRMFSGVAPSIDPMTSTVGLPMAPLRHTLRHRPVHQLPVAKDLAPDLDQLDDLLQYIGYTSPECLDANGSPLNTAGPSPLGPPLEAQTISIILNQRALETEYIVRQNATIGLLGESPAYCFGGSVGYTSFIDDNAPPAAIGSSGTLAANRFSTSQSGSDRTASISSNSCLDTKPFQFGRILFSQLGLAGWERRKRTHLLQRTDKLLRELRNLDNQKCRETHKMAVIYVANGQEDKNSILRNACGSSTYEMFVSALGWEVELESHNGFLGGLPRQGCGQTAPYYATPFLEVIFHVSTRMPMDTPEAILNKTRHLGNDEVHIVWSEHNRDYRRDILPTEFCDVLIVIYPLKSGLFRVTVNKKPDVPWFGPLSDEAVVGGSCLASLVRASAINASRAKRTSLSLYQQYYEERNRSLDTVAMRHKENNTFEDFTARIFSPIPSNGTVTGSGGSTGGSAALNAPLAAALIDHSRTSSKTWIHHPEMVATAREVTQQTVMASSGTSLDQPSPRPLRKLHHTFKPSASSKQPPKMSPVTTVPTGGTGGLPPAMSHHHYPPSAATPPDSPTLPGRTKFK